MGDTGEEYFPQDKKPELYRADNPREQQLPVTTGPGRAASPKPGRQSSLSRANNGSRPASAKRPSSATRPPSGKGPQSRNSRAYANRPVSGKRPVSANQPTSPKRSSPSHQKLPERDNSPGKSSLTSPNKQAAAEHKQKPREKTLSKSRPDNQTPEINKPPNQSAHLAEDSSKRLDVSSQGLTVIPTTVLANQDLVQLNLSCNNLRSLPSEISKLVNLTILDLSKNGLKCMHQKDFSGLPAEMRELQNLEELYISECNLPFIPPAIWGIKSLTVLDVSRNKINVLFPEIGELTSLRKLNLQQTNITYLPSEIASCQQLEELLLFGNALDTLPETLADLPCLRVLAVNYRTFCKIVDNYMENLIRRGQINSEHIPLVVFELPALQSLHLESTKINTVPEMYTDNLQEFSLYKNYLYEMPDTICKLSTLQVFDLSKNFIKVLPTKVSDLTHLTVLKVNDNDLDKIPSSIGKLVHLEELEMGGNKINQIPAEIKNLSGLRRLALDRNNIQSLPEEICTLTDLETLDMTENSIKKLPIRLYNLTRLTVAHSYKGLRKHGLWLYKNPIKQPPEAVWKTDKPNHIFSYLKKLQISQTENLQRQKVLLLGCSGAGKSSLMDAIVFGRATTSEETSDKTKVLDQTHWHSENGMDFIFYDIGGHDAYSMTLPLFLDPKAFIFLVFDLSRYNKEDYQQSIGKWLDVLNEFLPGCVVKIVGTKYDLCETFDQITADHVWKQVQMTLSEHNLVLNNEILRVKEEIAALSEDNIRSGVTSPRALHLKRQAERLQYLIEKPLKVIPGLNIVSAGDRLHGVQDLLHSTETQVLDKQLFPYAQRYIPQQWNKLRAVIKKKKSFCLSWNDVEELARKFHVTGDVLMECIQYLHEIGEVFWFKHIPSLESVVFHRPTALVEVIQTLYRHDAEDFLKYEQSQVFASRGELSQDQFEQAKDMFLTLGQISRPLLKCFWFYLNVDNQTIADYLELISKLNLGYTIPEPRVPNEKSYLTPLLVLPWFNTETLTDPVLETWFKSNKKQVLLDYSFCFTKAKTLFQTIISSAQDLLIERTDWRNAVLGVCVNSSDILILTNDKDTKGCHLKIFVRAAQLSAIEEAVKKLSSVVNIAIAQRAGLYWRLTVSTDQCEEATYQWCLND